MGVIHIYGAAGSGTTTLGRAIQDKLGCTHLDTDNYFWMPTTPPFTTKRSAKDRILLLRNDIIKENSVVLSGSLCGWGDEFIPHFDLVVRLVTPTEIGIKRLQKREFERFGSRICNGGDMYEEHIKFIQWASEYDDGDVSMRSKAMHDEWEKLIKCRHITLNGDKPTEKLLCEIFDN